MIKAIIFDWGGVCTYGGHSRRFAEMIAEQTHLNARKIRAAFLKYNCMYETEELNKRQFWKRFKGEIGDNHTMAFYTKYRFICYKANHRMLRFIKQLKKNYITVLCTNNNREMYAYIKKKHALKEYFNLMICSSKYVSRKPEKKIYLHIVNRLRLKP